MSALPSPASPASPATAGFLTENADVPTNSTMIKSAISVDETYLIRSTLELRTVIRAITWIWAAATSVALTCANPAFADTLHGRVIAISDGDTLTVLDRDHHTYKIRLEGIDAPEKAQPFGQQSKQHLSDLVFQADVTVRHQREV